MCELWDKEPSKSEFEMRMIDEPAFSICEDCGEKVHIGDWPVCYGKFGCHEPTRQYHPFIPWYDMMLGRHIGSLADWNRAMKETGFEMSSSKHDREAVAPKPSAKGLSKAFNKSVREMYGGVLPVGNYLDDNDD